MLAGSDEGCHAKLRTCNLELRLSCIRHPHFPCPTRGPTTHIVLRFLVGTQRQQRLHHLEVTLLAGHNQGCHAKRLENLRTSKATSSSSIDLMSPPYFSAVPPPPSPSQLPPLPTKFSLASLSAPAANRARTTSRCPCLLAMMRGVKRYCAHEI